jgi:hypothetical protein
MATIKNGRLVGEIPDSGLSGLDLVNALQPGGGRRAVIGQGVKVETIDPRKRYSKADLISRKTGKPVMLRTMPDRTKGEL